MASTEGEGPAMTLTWQQGWSNDGGDPESKQRKDGEKVDVGITGGGVATTSHQRRRGNDGRGGPVSGLGQR